MSQCPNSDANFNKLIGDRTPEERSKLYILCVVTRFLLYSCVYVFRDEPWMPYLVGTGSLLSMYQLSRPTKNKQWWSKKFQFFMAVFVFISALFAHVNSKAMATMLFISLTGGVLQRIHIFMC